MAWICKNCGDPNSGNYCAKCGQKNIDEISLQFLVNQLRTAVEFETGLFHNLKILTLRPAKGVEEFLNGKTKPFLNPVSYLLLGLSLLFFTTELVTKDDDSDLLNSAERIIYIATLTFPIYFGIILYGSNVDRKPEFIKGFITSIFLVAHILIIHTGIRSVLFLLDYLIEVRNTYVLLTSFSVALYFMVGFTRGYLGLTTSNVIIRLILSFIVVNITIFILFALISTSLETNILGYDEGKLIGQVIGILCDV